MPVRRPRGEGTQQRQPVAQPAVGQHRGPLVGQADVHLQGRGRRAEQAGVLVDDPVVARGGGDVGDPDGGGRVDPGREHPGTLLRRGLGARAASAGVLRAAAHRRVELDLVDVDLTGHHAASGTPAHIVSTSGAAAVPISWSAVVDEHQLLLDAHGELPTRHVRRHLAPMPDRCPPDGEMRATGPPQRLRPRHLGTGVAAPSAPTRTPRDLDQHARGASPAPTAPGSRGHLDPRARVCGRSTRGGLGRRATAAAAGPSVPSRAGADAGRPGDDIRPCPLRSRPSKSRRSRDHHDAPGRRPRRAAPRRAAREEGPGEAQHAGDEPRPEEAPGRRPRRRPPRRRRRRQAAVLARALGLTEAEVERVAGGVEPGKC